MAGSLNHIVAEDGSFTMDSIENLRDARDALEECHQIIAYLLPFAGRAIDNSDATGALIEALHQLSFPTSHTPILMPELWGAEARERHERGEDGPQAAGLPTPDIATIMYAERKPDGNVVVTHNIPKLDTSLRVRAGGPPGQFTISNEHVRKQNFDEEYVDFGGYFGPHKPETFAAAPELLAALIVFAECCDQIDPTESDEEWAKFRLTIGHYRAARDAVAKATGDHP